jgi:hypothetical protein
MCEACGCSCKWCVDEACGCADDVCGVCMFVYVMIEDCVIVPACGVYMHVCQNVDSFPFRQILYTTHMSYF